MAMGVNFKLLRRYRQIINILVKYGFQDILSAAGVSLKARVVETLLPKSMVEKIHQQNRWERMRLAVEELDLVHEGYNLQRFADNFKGSKTVLYLSITRSTLRANC